MKALRFILLSLACIAGALWSSLALGASFFVTSTANSGNGSLRDRIDTALITPSSPDTIKFAIPGAGPHTISLLTEVADITEAGLVIDGYTQSGATPNSLATGDNAVLKIILLDGASVNRALTLVAPSCVVRGLVINGFATGIRVDATAPGCVITGNFIGVDVSGTMIVANSASGVGLLSDNNVVGGTTPALRNIISGNDAGVLLNQGSAGNHIMGNYIGTDRNGVFAVGNATVGIYLFDADSNFIGGTTAGSGNLISGNGSIGIAMVHTSKSQILGNYIGTDRLGTSPLGNGLFGVFLSDSPGNRIGSGTGSGGNLISCHSNFNLLLQNDSTRLNYVEGNLIGTDVTGLAALSNPNGGIGIQGADSNFVGGAGTSRNVVSGMDGVAIMLQDSADYNYLRGNFVGVGTDAMTALPNGSAGVLVEDSRGNYIGVPQYGDPGNRIAYSAGPGIRVTGVSDNNTIRFNYIYANGGLGIDLDPPGATPNDPHDGFAGDPDSGPNGLQNWPALISAFNSGSATYVTGGLASAANESFVIQISYAANCDPSGYGEADAPVDTFTVVTNGMGIANFTHPLSFALTEDYNLSATATNATGATSEISYCIPITSAEITDTLQFFIFSPVHMVVTDPVGDSIGIDSSSSVVFNTILQSSSYDTTSDINSSGLTGPDGEPDDHVTIPHPIAGAYQVRLFVDENAPPGSHFTTTIRINGNQQMIPDGYNNQSVDALGNTVSTTFIWNAATTLPGDCNADGSFTAADIIFLVNYVFKGGPETPVPGHGDVNCDEVVTAADVINLVNFIFKSGLAPCSQTAG